MTGTQGLRRIWWNSGPASGMMRRSAGYGSACRFAVRAALRQSQSLGFTVIRLAFPTIAALLLSGCFQSETGPRNFDINTATATPASADPHSAQQLVANTSESYVTMVVYEASL